MTKAEEFAAMARMKQERDFAQWKSENQTLISNIIAPCEESARQGKMLHQFTMALSDSDYRKLKGYLISEGFSVTADGPFRPCEVMIGLDQVVPGSFYSFTVSW